jgi:hypothetical protein
MKPETTAVVEIALINLSFAQAELAPLEDPSGAVRRAFEHIKLAIAGLAGLAPNFGCIDEEAA